ncbi:MAG: hypothetical protein MH219_17550 [Marinobacter sp.]|jgi:uncharacterized small protein (DUF1192 family)|nr:hypothetical protein [Marinobacter sp.]MCL1484260.1 hypothetical protein [Marinobacter sp.]
MGNGKTFGAANLAAFQEWSDKRTVQNDWERFIRQEKLNRTKIAEDCQFGTAVFGQNPGVSRALQALEIRLRREGILPPIGRDPTETTAALTSVSERSALNALRLERRVKTLEERCAVQQAEILRLNQKLNQYKHIDDHLAQTGRLLPL